MGVYWSQGPASLGGIARKSLPRWIHFESGSLWPSLMSMICMRNVFLSPCYSGNGCNRCYYEGPARDAVKRGVLPRRHVHRAGPLRQGGSSQTRCYRDTKMEMQGQAAAPNLQSQHGGLRSPASSALRFTAAALSEVISAGTEGDGAQSDKNSDNRPKTSPFHLLVDYGSGASSPLVAGAQPVDGAVFPSPACLEDRALNADKEPEPSGLLGSTESVRTGLKSADSAIQMALSLFEGDEELILQRNLSGPSAALVDVTHGQYSLSGHTGSSMSSAVTRELLDVFTSNSSRVETTTRRVEASLSSQGKRDEAERTRADFEGSMEVGSCSQSILCHSPENHKSERQPGTKVEPGVVLRKHRVHAANAGRAGGQNTVVLTNKHGERICGHISPHNSDGKPARDLDEGGGSASAMDSSEFFSTFSTSVPASETFSGTITINNQNITMTIENGVLTLAASQEGCIHKEDDVLTLKEHLGMKDHEDVVLLNYESGTKSIGKIGTLAVTSLGPQGEPRPEFSVSDSELALVDDCSVPELSPSLEPCSIVKQEMGALCVVAGGELVTPRTKVPTSDCTTGDLPSVPLIRSKKETSNTFSCPESGCSCVFDTRQKLKVHLLNHAEDPRPYQCTMDGCCWAFATSYKLKRHLQSHDKQRPHTCQFEGCGRRFTTIYNLKAHVKVHEQDSTFVCEICSERFRSATRLASHQRVHFAPQRPHKCEFPGSPDDAHTDQMQK